MIRLFDIAPEIHTVMEYSPEAICRALVPPGFVPSLTGDIDCAVRLLFAPSFHAELVVTAERSVAGWEFAIHSARLSLWRFTQYGAEPLDVGRSLAEAILPPASWEARGMCDESALPECLTSDEQFAALWRPQTGVLRIDGCGVSACRVTSTGVREFKHKGATPWIAAVDDFCVVFLNAIRRTCSCPDACAMLDDVLTYFGVGRQAQ